MRTYLCNVLRCPELGALPRKPTIAHDVRHRFKIDYHHHIFGHSPVSAAYYKIKENPGQVAADT